MMDRKLGIALALISALLFGVGTPIIKLLFSSIDPLLLAGLISLGSGTGVALLTRVSLNPARLLNAQNRFFFCGAVSLGGIIAPFLLFWAIEHGPSSNASLLLNLEAAMTVLIAWGVFRDHISNRIVLGLIMVTLGGAVLSTGAASGGSDHFTACLAAAASCVCWAIDNNFTARLRNVSSAQFTIWKGLISGAVLLGSFATMRETPLPPSRMIFEALLLGTCCHGLALLAFVVAIKRLGAGETTAYFAIAPFVGAAVAVLVLGEAVSARLLMAAALMACGIIALVTAPAGAQSQQPALAS